MYLPVEVGMRLRISGGVESKWWCMSKARVKKHDVIAPNGFLLHSGHGSLLTQPYDHPRRHTGNARPVHTFGKPPRCHSVVLPGMAWTRSCASHPHPADLLRHPSSSTTHESQGITPHTTTTMMLLSARQALRTAARTVRVPVTAAARSVATNAKVSLV